ncbi:hypothetical protein F5884DRAFT_745807 [Xylogone sp. PMI_703]|nr:hypothetical protein F5884DRAFT_745807 [Xylogone sp. PMI_703]
MSLQTLYHSHSAPAVVARSFGANLAFVGQEESSENPDLLKKQRRRAQVRKAQIEHRQRKQNYVKFLEEDVKRFREMIAAIETEKSFLRVENSNIKDTLTNSNISYDHLNLYQGSQNNSQMQLDHHSPGSVSSYSNSSPTSIVSMKFDHEIYNHCLQVSNSPGPLNARVETLPMNKLNINSRSPTTPASGPMRTSHTKSGAPSPLDVSSIAINFILALEHPCRSHFHAANHTGEWDPKVPESNHELMASTYLYAHAPPSVFKDLDNASWPAPTLELSELLAMSRSLNSSDFEITPVQAWFLLQDNYSIAVVLRGLDALKHDLSSLVDCWGFGAVVDRDAFWAVTRRILEGK